MAPTPSRDPSLPENRAGNADEADDLLQEVFLQGVASGQGILLDRKRARLVVPVARNRLVDRLRLTKEQVPLPDDLLAESSLETDPVDLLSYCLPRVLSELTEDRDVIVLCDIEGMTQKAYAERLGLPLATAKSRVQRARLRLRSQLATACKFDFRRRRQGLLLHSAPAAGI